MFLSLVHQREPELYSRIIAKAHRRAGSPPLRLLLDV